MNKQFLISSLVMFVASLLVGFVVHAVLLNDDYAALPDLYRSNADSQHYTAYMLIAHLLRGIGLTWVYRMGRDESPWPGQGLRFGLAMAVLITVPVYMIYYAVQPMPETLAVKQILFETPGMLLLGLLAAALNRPA